MSWLWKIKKREGKEGFKTNNKYYYHIFKEDSK